MSLTRRELLASSLAAVALAACGPSKPRQKLLWSEEFDHLDLASPLNPRGKWRPNDVWQPLDQGYADFATGQHSTWLANPAQQIPGVDNPFSVKDSVLSISCSRTPPQSLGLVNGCPWVGGLLVSNTDLPSMVFGYGYYEFKARFPNAGKGMFPALWFYAARDKNPQSQSAAEIDVFEIFGGQSGMPWASTLHGDKQYDVQSQMQDTHNWHTYGLDWTADHIDFYYDGYKTASAIKEAVPFFAGAKMSIRINYVVDAMTFPPDNKSDASTPSPLSLDLDYIRKYNQV